MSSGFEEMAASHSTAQNRKAFGASAGLSQTHCPRILQVSEAGLTLVEICIAWYISVTIEPLRSIDLSDLASDDYFPAHR